MAAEMCSRFSGSVRKTTQPPPPAPQTLAASAPWRKATAISFSIIGVMIVEDFLVAINVRFEYFPIIDPGLARRSGIDEHKPAVQFLRRHAYGGVVNAIGIQVNGAHATIQSRIIILASCGDFDELGFNVLRDDAHLLTIKLL